MEARLKNRYILHVAIFGLVSLLVGCGPADRLYVDGEVSFDGEPIEYGHVQFSPIGGTEAPTGGAEIKDGKYEIDSVRGLYKGSYRVEIQAWKRDGKRSEDPVTGEFTEGGDLKAILPKKFNEDSEMTVEVESGKQTHNFTLTSED